MSVSEVQIKCEEQIKCIVCGKVMEGWTTACECIVEAVQECVEVEKQKDCIE